MRETNEEIYENKDMKWGQKFKKDGNTKTNQKES